MLKTDLFQVVSNGENSGVEFKEDTIGPRDLAKELVAFSNLDGGSVLLGVRDDSSIAGITREGLEEWVMNTCRDKIRPEIIPYFEVVKDVEPGKDVAVVRVEAGWGVHAVWHNSHKTYYIRVGTESREASTEELERLFQQRGGFRVELRPVSGSTLGDLDIRRLTDYFCRVRGQDAPNDDNEWARLLSNAELLSEEDGDHSCNVAGLVLFGSNPARFLPHVAIDCAAYPGLDKDYAARERLSIRSPLVSLFDEKGDPSDSGAVEQAIQFVSRNTPVAGHVEETGIRSDRPAYPLEAIREALVNAVVHRDYLLSGTTIEISVYDDRVEVVSPGRLPNGITIPRMVTGCRAARNQLIKDVMRDYGYLEHMGMGVPRKIVRCMREHNGTDPQFVIADESFAVRLYR